MWFVYIVKRTADFGGKTVDMVKWMLDMAPITERFRCGRDAAVSLRTGSSVSAILPVTLLAALLVAPRLAHGQDGCLQVENLGPLNGPATLATGVSADGTVVVGTTYVCCPGDRLRAFRWTEAGGTVPLGPSNMELLPSLISSNGSVIAGTYITSTYFAGFRWSESTGMQSVGTLPGTEGSRFVGMSPDGSVLIGLSVGASGNYYRSFRWTQAGGIQDLGQPTTWSNPQVVAVSRDCSVAVGNAHELSVPRFLAFRWTLAGGTQDLGMPPGFPSNWYAVATSISADGLVVGGYTRNSSNDAFRAFRWTHAEGMQDLGVLPGDSFSKVLSVSGDGSVMIGTSWVASQSSRVFRWTQAGGMQLLQPPPGREIGALLVMSHDGLAMIASTTGSGAPFRWTASGGWVDLGMPTGITTLSSAFVSADLSVVIAHGNAGGGPVFRWSMCDCAADLDNGTGAGTTDGAVTIDDLLFFLVGFEAGSSSVDLDNGTNTGTPDGAVDINDLLFFLGAFEAGC